MASLETCEIYLSVVHLLWNTEVMCDLYNNLNMQCPQQLLNIQTVFVYLII